MTAGVRRRGSAVGADPTASPPTSSAPRPPQRHLLHAVVLALDHADRDAPAAGALPAQQALSTSCTPRIALPHVTSCLVCGSRRASTAVPVRPTGVVQRGAPLLPRQREASGPWRHLRAVTVAASASPTRSSKSEYDAIYSRIGVQNAESGSRVRGPGGARRSAGIARLRAPGRADMSDLERALLDFGCGDGELPGRGGQPSGQRIRGR